MSLVKNSNTTYVDYLDEDEPISNQNYVCISFLSPEKIKNTNLRGIKIRGVFRTREEADEHCKLLQTRDPCFDVFVGEVGKWLPWNPDPNDAKDQIYQEKELNDLMKGYKENLEKTKRMEQQRKTDMIKQASKQQQKSSSVRDRLKKKLDAKNKAKEVGEPVESVVPTSIPVTEPKIDPELEEKDKLLKEQEEMAKNELKRLTTLEQTVHEKEHQLESIDDKLAKFQQLYAKLNSK